MPMSWLTADTVVDRVVAMKKQEESGYNYRNYFPQAEGRVIDTQLNVAWREKISHWSYNVVDHFNLSREVVGISLKLFDRFFATRGNKCNGNLALLTSLTTLHIAIKLHESKKIKLSTLANLSRGQFGPSHIEEMEWVVLAALGWRVNPPTEYSFISHFLLFLPQEAQPGVRKEIMELSRYLSELTACDSFFVDCKASTIAFASMLNVMEDMSFSRLSAGIREKFLRNISEKVQLSYRASEVVAARSRIRSMFSTSTVQDSAIPATKSMDDNLSVSSSGSTGSWANRNLLGRRGRANSTDSKGSCRYSPSPRRRCVPIASPMTTSRARVSSSPITAMIQ